MARIFLMVVSLGIGVPVWAEESIVFDAWSRATPPGSSSAAIYGELENRSGERLELKKVEYPGAHHVMIHQTVEEDGMARMRHASMVLEPGESATLKPGGLHVMIMGLSDALVTGCQYPFVLHWSNGLVTEHQTLTGSYGQSEKPSETQASCP